MTLFFRDEIIQSRGLSYVRQPDARSVVDRDGRDSILPMSVLQSDRLFTFHFSLAAARRLLFSLPARSSISRQPWNYLVKFHDFAPREFYLRSVTA